MKYIRPWQINVIFHGGNLEKIKSHDLLKIVSQSCKLFTITQVTIGAVTKGREMEPSHFVSELISKYSNRTVTIYSNPFISYLQPQQNDLHFIFFPTDQVTTWVNLIHETYD